MERLSSVSVAFMQSPQSKNMKAKLSNITTCRFGPFTLTGPRLSKPGIRAIQMLVNGVREGKVQYDTLENVARALKQVIVADEI